MSEVKVKEYKGIREMIENSEKSVEEIANKAPEDVSSLDLVKMMQHIVKKVDDIEHKINQNKDELDIDLNDLGQVLTKMIHSSNFNFQMTEKTKDTIINLLSQMNKNIENKMEDESRTIQNSLNSTHRY